MSFSSPMQLFDSAHEAYLRRDYRALAAHCDRDSMAQIQRHVVGQAMDPEHGEYALQVLMPDFESWHPIIALDPAQFFAAHVEGFSVRRQAERLVRAGTITRERADRLISEMEQLETFIALGWVPDGHDFAHVVFRHAGPHAEGFAPYVRTAPCRRQPDGGWLLVAEQYMFGLSGMSSSIDSE